MTPDLFAEMIVWVAIITVFAGVLALGGFIADWFDRE